MVCASAGAFPANDPLRRKVRLTSATGSIGEQTIAERRFDRPGSYRETFEIPGARGVLEPDLAVRLANLAAFRNVLVHVYWKLDLERVEANLREGREPLDRFCAVVKRLLGE